MMIRFFIFAMQIILMTVVLCTIGFITDFSLPVITATLIMHYSMLFIGIFLFLLPIDKKAVKFLEEFSPPLVFTYEQYYVCIDYPIMSEIFSKTINFLRKVSLFYALVCLWYGMYWNSFLFLFYYPIGFLFVFKINPIIATFNGFSKPRYNFLETCIRLEDIDTFLANRFEDR
jgi:hypothetical protein